MGHFCDCVVNEQNASVLLALKMTYGSGGPGMVGLPPKIYALAKLKNVFSVSCKVFLGSWETRESHAYLIPL